VIHCLKSPVTVAPAIVSLFMSVGFLAACGDPAEATLILSESNALSACEDEAGCDGASSVEEVSGSEGGWASRCESDSECSIGHCVCGMCTESCNGEADACSGSPDGASCYAGHSLPRAALCHATTVPGICLMPCASNDECGAGQVCALDVCVPQPKSSET
jgi:hypothetical protein